VTRVHQALSGAGPYDAVTVQALRWRELLKARGYRGGVHAGAITPAIRREVQPLGALRPDPGDLTVIHYSAYAPHLGRVLAMPGRKLIVHHNVTPARFLWEHAPNVAASCALARRELPRYLEAADAVAAVSEYNAQELREAGADEVSVVPILLDPDRVRLRGEAPPGEGPLVLVVGRLVPNKRHDLAAQAFEAYRQACEPQARLLFIGEPLTPAYRRLVESWAPGAVRGRISHGDLNSAYAEASVLLSTSEHEGFCVPLLEAFEFGLPVVARPAGGMPEVGGDAVLWADEEPFDAAVVAELIDAAVRDSELRAELARRGLERLEHYAPERVSEQIVAAVEGALGR
jgi:L-malate glycosyltransferase